MSERPSALGMLMDDSAIAAVWSCCALMHSTQSEEIATFLLTDHPEEIPSLAHSLGHGLPHAVGRMNEVLLRRFVSLALTKHGDDALRFMALEMTQEEEETDG